MGEAAEVNEKRRFLGKIGLFLGKMFSLLPIIASILAPMFLVFGAFVYFSYNLFLYPFVDIVNYYFMFPLELPPYFIPLIVTECVVFLIGLYIFLDALITMSLQKKRSTEHPIVKKRLYKYIRHPQNLGILLMIIPFILYIPGLRDPGIRSGDILSWILFFLLTSIKSLVEEKHMLNKYGEDYFIYIQTTGFYTPLRLIKIKEFTKKEIKRYFIWSTVIQIVFTGIFIVIGVVFFTQYHTVLIRFPPPGFYIPEFDFYEWLPFLIFLSCIHGVIFYILWNYIKKRKSSDAKGELSNNMHR